MTELESLREEVKELRGTLAYLAENLSFLYKAVRESGEDLVLTQRFLVETREFIKTEAENNIDRRDKDIRERIALKKVLIDNHVMTYSDFNRAHGIVTHKFDQAKAEHADEE